ncbi:MAG: sodium:proton antiporter [Alphaproteobacteria bacterium]|nr:MAG: sodium:proton antiporter [Alphaproteobacteria bacterium]
METVVQNIEFLLLIAAIVAMVVNRLRMPYIVGLTLAGIGLAFSPVPIELPLTRDLVFYILLPPLIFEAAFHIPWKGLRKDLVLIMAFATIGVVFSAAVTAVGMHQWAGWGWPAALCFGTLIAATDPVSVISTFKEAGAHGRLRLLLESESVLNDGTAAVAFTIALAVTAGGDAAGPLEALNMLLLTVFGGVICGAVLAGFVMMLAGRTDDHLVEITFTTIAAWGSFLLAEHYHVSGIIACMTAGVILGNYGDLGSWNDVGRKAVAAFWEYAAFVSNSLIFILIGIYQAKQNIWGVIVPASIAVGLVTLGRAAAIYPVALMFRKSRWKVKMKHQHVLFWGGLRGALALALAMGLPEDMPGREAVITVTFSVVAFSVFVQATTMGALLRRFREIPALKKAGRR